VVRILNLTGDPRSIGRQHGEQVADMRPKIQASMKVRLSSLYEKGVDPSTNVNKIIQIWQQHAPNTLEMLRGMAETLDLNWEEYMTYTIASYINSCLNNTSQSEGCTTWAAGGNITRDGAPILVKNRDNPPDQQSLQCLARIQPEDGHPYLCLTTAGSPAVFSSGINDVGLSVVDTFIASTDLGPGIGRYSLMMDILQNFSTVREAINYLPTHPYFGDGSVTVVDALGDMAVFEIAHSVQAVRRSDEGFIACTNHFTAPETRSYWVDKEDVHLRGNSQGRLNMIEDALRSAKGQVDVPWSMALMGQHGDSLSAPCRHIELDPQGVTISCAIFLPRQSGMFLADGNPCRTPFEFIQVAT